ncbi:hypothetical protein CFR75_13550 [Komagataeibacter xylinus]|uniref:Uncharacterized protein n=1 Tax=Komagataeibacter xylinus TaxID=28448 RepID=A0A318PIS7_KOMXY|nr:DUF6880 family protein [Komagataeibacter xylinus]AZV38662.1 hypothetical protein CXP35_07425 [Komagataeibacter xylinus]PYD55975.1 hypothetical protein CFR75_13550 [Komagataeibacter xylinus]GBQ82137.1 hypothetical protein AA15237_3254 [Komagataeibacter xylinus NBRC 15237]
MARTPSTKPATRKSAASAKVGTTVTKENLKALGPDRLADLLVELSEQDAVLTRKLRMALTATHAKDKLGKEIEKRLRTIQCSRGFLPWDRIKPLATELDTLRQSILDDVATTEVGQAISAMRILVELTPSVYERSDDSSGYLSDVFREAASDLGTLWGRQAGRDPAVTVRDLLTLLDNDGYGTCDHLIASCGEALGTAGAAILRSTLLARLHDLPASKAKGDYRTDIRRIQTLGHLKDLADAMGDVDAYIEAVSLSDRQSASIGDVARRLLDKERASKALEWLDRETEETSRSRSENDDLRIEACEAVGDRDTAQSLRWKVFQERLSLPHWQAYQRHLSDYDAIDAEEQTLNYIRNFPVRSVALSTLLEWPALDAAANLVREHTAELDGRDYGTLRPAADRLSESYPNEATLLYRLLVEAVLDKALSRYYSYAAKDLASCRLLALMLTATNGMETHEAFMTRLKAQHKRKLGFWSLIGE